MQGARLGDERVGLAVAAGGIVLLTAAMAPFHADVGLLNQGLIFLLLTLLVSATWGLRPGILAAVLSNVALNYFFTEPLHRLHVAEARNVFGLAIFLVVSLVGGSLLASARRAAGQALRRQAQTEALLRMSRAMAGRADPQEALDALCTEVMDAFDAGGAALLTRAEGGWTVISSAGGEGASRVPGPEERAMADRATSRRSVEGAGQTGLRVSRIARVVGRGTGSRAAPVIVAPLLIGDQVAGVLRVDGPLRSAAFREHPEELLRAFAAEAALAVQRLQLSRAAAQTEALQEASEAKTNLLLAVSHDLKTPLAAIKTSVSALLDRTVEWSEEDKQAFLETIDTQADALNGSISAILDWNRVETGAVRPLLKDAPALDLLQDAAERCAATLSGRRLSVDASPDILVRADPSLTVQALVNVIENAAKYSRPDGEIRLRAVERDGHVDLRVEDDGPGIAAGDLPHVFERYYRARREGSAAGGSGLGLALVKAFVELSGGTVAAQSSQDGSVFMLTFPSARAMRSSA